MSGPFRKKGLRVFDKGYRAVPKMFRGTIMGDLMEEMMGVKKPFKKPKRMKNGGAVLKGRGTKFKGTF